MIIYFAGRIMAWMYGYAWPLESQWARSLLATFSTMELVVLGPMAVGFVVTWAMDALGSRKWRDRQ